MNAQTIQGSWNQVRGKLKEKWGQLTEDDLRLRDGNLDQVIGRIQQKTGETREAIESFLTEISGNGATAVAKVAQAVSDTVGEVGERLRGQMSHLSDQASEGYAQAQRYLQRNPAPSIAAVFGLGLGLGLLLGITLRSR